MPKSWFNVRVCVPHRESEELEQWFFAQGALAVTQETPEGLLVFESENSEYADEQLIPIVGLFEENIRFNFL